ncbi:ergothioneine biosynthesis protein EgtB [Pyruvatibacter mobilis]|uniref:ergothioneine biosynthesis protein EgtB n=1 Tax=Pyruvatibacter mobilis TaxID=1712261 RepID=UPI003BAABC0F
MPTSSGNTAPKQDLSSAPSPEPAHAAHGPERLGRTALLDRFRAVRGATECLSAPLTPEDQMLQSMEEASPARWHRAHTTWFFETFVLKPHDPAYEVINPAYDYLFNSYYQAVGPQYSRPHRGLVSRPTVAEVTAYRAYVDDAVTAFADRADDATWQACAPLIELGLHHEQQHQELMVTDLKHALSFNPLWPSIYPAPETQAAETPLGWQDFPGGIILCGHTGNLTEDGFAYDCEGPRHQVLLRDFALASRPITNAEFIAFMEDGGYCDPRWWHSEGWDRVCAEAWTAPLYWLPDGDAASPSSGWTTYTLHGRVPVAPHEPVCHISFFEAAAYAAWASEQTVTGDTPDVRLPTEFELEHAASGLDPRAGHFAGTAPGTRALHPRGARVDAEASAGGLQQIFGDVWEWTQSAYAPYPGFKPAAGAIGEYNGKFMANQMVLRGGSVATPEDHMRATYRNFFPAHSRWQFSGLRLARDL